MTDVTTAPDADRLLAVYLNDHLAGATGGAELAHRLARAEQSWSGGPDLSRLAAEIAEDRTALKSLMTRLGVAPSLSKMWIGWLGERAGRLKPNRRVLGRSPLSRVIELELIRLGVEGKLACWRSLEVVAEHETRLPSDELTRLIRRATEQIETLETLRRRAATEAFARI